MSLNIKIHQYLTLSNVSFTSDSIIPGFHPDSQTTKGGQQNKNTLAKIRLQSCQKNLFPIQNPFIFSILRIFSVADLWHHAK